MHETVAPLQMGLNVAGSFGILGTLFAASRLIGRRGRRARRLQRRATVPSAIAVRKGKHEVSLTGIPRIGRATVIGAVIGGVSLAVPAVIVLVLMGGGAVSVLAGVHFGFFGGAGYGGMIGAVVQADRSQRLRQGGINHDRNASGQRQPTQRAA